MAVIDAAIRLVPDVLGDEESSQTDSFSGAERLLEFAQYTRPREFRGLEVPPILLGGDHQAIARWREANRTLRTRQRRADLLENHTLTERENHEPGPAEAGREEQLER
jgi:tRNA (guanine37-N1)-methyltransferase